MDDHDMKTEMNQSYRLITLTEDIFNEVCSSIIHHCVADTFIL